MFGFVEFLSSALIHVHQDSPLTNAGVGSCLTLDGTVECDASIMDGYEQASVHCETLVHDCFVPLCSCTALEFSGLLAPLEVYATPSVSLLDWPSGPVKDY